MILTFTMGSVVSYSIVSPLLVALVSGFGNALGNVLVYLTGRGGLAFFRNLGVSRPKPNGEQKATFWRKVRNWLAMPRLKQFARKSSFWAVFVLSIYPNPILTPVIVGMGAARSNFWRFFLYIWVGKTAQCLILSYLGYFGLRSILRYFGVTLP